MRHFYNQLAQARLFSLLLLWLLAAVGTARAQAPAWELALGSDSQPNASNTSTIVASATDAHGNVFITGGFTGAIDFGSTHLVSAGLYDIFVAKWDATAQAFTWATSGGGTSSDVGFGIAVSGNGVFVTGYFNSGANASLAGQALSGAGGRDMFVVKYVDTSTGNTPATSGFAKAWVVSGGGSGNDQGNGIAVSGTGVYVTGYFDSATNASLAGQVLAGAGRGDMFVAKYLDMSTGSTGGVANGWAISGGGTGVDTGLGIAVSGTGVYVTGYFGSAANASLAGQMLAGAGGADLFVAKYLDMGTSSVANGWAVSGGGTGTDVGYRLAVSGTGVYVAGEFGSAANASVAGQALAGAGGTDLVVAKYSDTSTGSTSSVANGWAVSGGGTGNDQANDIAVSGTGVYVTGYFGSAANASVAGQALAGAGGADLFVAKYLDVGTSNVANGWAVSGGGTGNDQGNTVVVSGQRVYVGGYAAPPATFSNLTFGTMAGMSSLVLGRLTDPTTLPTRTAGIGTYLALYPNPAPGAATLTGAAPGQVVQVLDALGRLVATASADAAGTARLVGLPAGLCLVRAGAASVRLAVE